MAKLTQGRCGQPIYRAFGGCDFPNPVPRVINSLRLELIGESSLVPASAGFFFSPLMMLGYVLLQVVRVKESELARGLWCPEAARELRRGWLSRTSFQLNSGRRRSGSAGWRASDRG